MVAVSDAINRDPHPFTLDWDDAAQHQAVLQKMQVAWAQAQLALHGNLCNRSSCREEDNGHTHKATSRPGPTAFYSLLDEDLKAYTLSYGGAATYIYSANTGGTGAALVLCNDRRAGGRIGRHQARHSKCGPMRRTQFVR